MKALILAPFERGALEHLRRYGEVVYEPWTETRRLCDPEELGERLQEEGFDVLVIESDFVCAETLSAAPGLKLVGLCRGDVGPHVDVAAAAGAGVLVTSTPGRNAVSVAELAIALMLALSRRVVAAHAAIREGRWQGALQGYCAWQGQEICGKTVGLVGLGAVGREVAQRLNAFRMEVIASDPFVTIEAAHALGVTLVPLHELLRRSDFVSIHAVLNERTRSLIAAQELALMKSSAFLVNTARAAIVDEQALLSALQERRIAGAALDVHGIEPLPPNSPWLRLDNVILTPHMGGATSDVIRRHSWMIVDDVERWLRGESPLHLVGQEGKE